MSFKHIQVPPEWILYFIHILASSKERCVFILYGTLPIIMLSRALDLRHRLCRVMQLTFSRSLMPGTWCHFFCLCLLSHRSQDDDKDIENCLLQSRLCTNMEKVN